MATAKQVATKDAVKESSKEKPEEFGTPDVLECQPCPICSANALTLTESEREIAFFGRVYLFSMTCTACKYHKADLEAAEKKDPSKWTIEIKGKEDLNIRIVKSAEATVKIPHIVTIESGPSSQGYVTNVEGLLMRVKGIIEGAKDAAEDADEQDQARKHLKKLNRVLWGEDPLKITIEDPTGNSAIISEKAVKGKLK